MKEFENIKIMMSQLEQALNKKKLERIRNLMINIIVGLEKICHKKDMNIHYVLGEARERCKKEIKK